MSKYNRIQSIPVSSIPKEEMAQAIKEWAEGDEAMERLLWACYNNGLITNGCHAGAFPYISFNPQKDGKELLSLFEVTQNEDDFQILITIDGGNPFSGPEWYLPNINFSNSTEYKDEADIYFDKLTQAIENKKEGTHPMIELFEFFKEKETALLLRLRKKSGENLKFTIETRPIIDDRYEYYNKVFTKAGLVEVKHNSGDEKRHAWKIEDKEVDSILGKISKATRIIENEFMLDEELEEENILSFINLAKFKKKNLTEEEFDEWLAEKREKLFSERSK